jgi:hypothetical protein
MSTNGNKMGLAAAKLLGLAAMAAICSTARADVAFQTDGASAAWTTTANGGSQQVVTELPNDETSQLTIASGGSQGEVGAETFTTGSSPFTLTAFEISSQGGAAVASGLSIHLFALNSTTNAGSGGYVPSTAVSTSGSNTTGDLLGLIGTAGQGLTFAYGGQGAPGTGTADLMEFDLSNGANSSDQITLAANTLYAVEIWNTSTSGFLWNRTNAPAYAGGQAYATGGLGATESSTVSRNQLIGGSPRIADLAVFGTSASTPEPASLGLLGIAAMGLMGRRRGQKA